MHTSRLSRRLTIFGRWFFVFALVVSLAASAFLTQTTRAASPIHVNASAAPGGDGLTWATAFNDLQDAINAAVSGEEIWVAAGAYTPKYPLVPEDPRTASFFLKNGVSIYGGFAGTETQRDARDWMANVTLLDGHVTPTEGAPYQVYHVVRGENLYSLIHLDGLTISGGRADGEAGTGNDFGGGIQLSYANMVLENLIIRDNDAHIERGGGGGMSASYSPLTVENVRFVSNTAYMGGGFYSHENDGIVINNSVFDGNLTSFHGAGYFDFQTDSTLTNSTFVGNISDEGGGGIFNFMSRTRVFNSTFTGNQAGRLAGSEITAYGNGGGIGVNSDEQVWVQDCLFQGNEATLNGGAVHQAVSPGVWYRNTFIDNHAVGYGGAFHTERSAPWIGNSLFLINYSLGMGGALDLDQYSSGVVTNSVFNGNHSEQGGAIRINGPSSPTLTNLTVANNRATDAQYAKGGGLMQMSTVDDTANSTVVNSIFYGNTGMTQIHLLNARMDLSNSILTQAPYLEGVSTVLGSAGLVYTNPLFIDFNGADNIAGNADDDFRIPSNSPAVDVGVPGDLDTYDLDEDGNAAEPYPFQMGNGPRIADLQNAPIAAPSSEPVIDLGAYEAQPPALTVVKTSSQETLAEADDFPVTITVTNNGLGEANDVVISDAMPAGLTLVAGTVTRSMGAAGTLPVLAQGFDLLPGQSATVGFMAVAADGPASITNTAQAAAYEVITPVEGSAVFTINNLPPHDIVVTPPVGTIYEGSSAQYTGSYVDPAGDLDAPFSALWNFGDGGAAVAGTFNQAHTYADSGTFQIVLGVTDGDGGSANSLPTAVTITNVAPQVSINPIAAGVEGASMIFTGAFTDVAQALDAPYTYTWTLDATRVIGSGTVATYNAATPPIVTATAAMGAGTHTVTLLVTDKDGGSTSRTSSTFTVADVAPEVTVTATGSPIEGTPFTFQAVVVDPGLDYSETFTFSWNFGAGPVSGAISQAHTFADSGSYNVTVTATGSHGGSDTSPVYPVTASNAVPVISIQPVSQADEGETIPFQGSFTDLAGANDLNFSYEWRLDGATVIGSGTVTAYNPALPPVVTATRATGSGAHTVTLTVTDQDGGTGTATADFVVDNVPPSPGVTSTGTAFEGTAFTLTGSFTDPGQSYGETYTYSWNFGDGTAPVTGTLTPAHTFVDSGTYSVVLTVTDSDTASASSLPYALTVSNVAPSPSIQPVVGAVEGASLSFSGSFTDPAGVLDLNYSYIWRLDGVQIGSGTVNSYNPAVPPVITASAATSTGPHTLTLQVTDQDGGSTTATRDFSVTNVNPTVDLSSAGTAYDGVPYAFSLAFTDPGQAYGETYTIRWNFGDGIVIPNGDLSEEHAFATQGSHTVTVTVTDGHGGEGSDSLTISVQNSAPQATIQEVTGVRMEGTVLSFHGSGTDASPSGSIVAYAWDFGDNSAGGSGATPSHTYRDNGTYTVTLTVTDNQDATGTITYLLTIGNAAPVVDAGSTPFGSSGQPLQFLGSFTDAGLDDTHTIAWDFGDGTPLVTGMLNPTHTYSTDGIFIVTLTVTDNDGGIGSDAFALTLSPYKYFIPMVVRK